MKKVLLQNIGLTIVTLVISIFVSELFVGHDVLDIRFHDAYFAFPLWTFEILLTSFTVYLVFVVVCARRKFRKRTSLWFLFWSNTVFLGVFIIFAYPVVVLFKGSVLPAYLLVILVFIVSEFLVVRRMKKINSMFLASSHNPRKRSKRKSSDSI